MKKLMLLATGFGGLVSVLLPVALGAGGGQSIAAAPTLPVGVTVGHAEVLSSCSGYGEFWRIKLSRGDQLRLDYGSKSGQPVQIALYTPTTTDANIDNASPLDEASTTYKDEVVYKATASGRYVVLLHTIYACQKSIYYYLTAHVVHGPGK